MTLKKGGWQVNVEYYDNHVIKTPKSKEEIIEKISKYLESKNEIHKLDKLVGDMERDWKNSINIVSASNIPLRLLANPVFLDDGKIKQEKVVILDELFEKMVADNDIDRAKLLVDDVIEFILELWRHGIHEKTYKFYSEYGMLNDKIALIDFGEITDDIDKVKKQILKGTPTFDSLRRYYDDNVLDYFLEQRKNILTTERLEKEWGKYNE